MAVAFHAFWMPRLGHSRDEYEDAFASEPASGRYAIADGASEGAFTGLWARLLVEGFVSTPQIELPRWPAALAALQAEWSAQLQGRELPWYGEKQVAQGAFATFLGLIVDDGGEAPHRWRAIAVGDSCLFHTRGHALLKVFPIGNSEEFGTNPRLLGSRMSAERATANAYHGEGSAAAGDRLWMMTDALAQWCLASHETGANPWREMEPLMTPEPTGGPFEVWVDQLRTAGRLRNDDVTLLVLETY